MKKIVVIGSSNVDITMHVATFPQPGETINASAVTSAAGGKGANQAVAAAKSGAQTYFIGRVGDDGAGKFMLTNLKNYGVLTDCLHVTEHANTGHAYIALAENGQNDIIIDHGANYQVSIADVKAAEGFISQADCIIAQFETPLKATIAAFKLAKQHGLVTILNPAPAIRQIPADLLAVTDAITPNETESAAITGLEIKNEADLKANAQKLHALGVKNVIITYGDKGAYLSSPALEELVPAFKVKAVDTTGAGDTFIGYLAGNLKKDFSNLKQAAIIASRASSLAVQHLGAQPSIPAAKEVMKLMETKNG